LVVVTNIIQEEHELFFVFEFTPLYGRN